MPDSPSADSREQRLDALLASFLEETAAGRPPDREALLARHPDLADDLKSFLADHDRMRQAARGESPRTPGANLPTVGPGEGHLTTAEAPRALGDYEVLSELGRGAMGVVYKARQVSLDRLVALKMILSGQFASADDVQRF